MQSSGYVSGASNLGNQNEEIKQQPKLEPSCCKKWQKKSNQETGLGNRGRLKALNGTKLVLNEHE